MFGKLLGEIISTPLKAASAVAKVGNKTIDAVIGEEQDKDEKPIENALDGAAKIVKDSVEEAFDE